MIYIMTTEMTPKIDDKGVAFSLRSRDYKDPQVIIIEDEDEKDSVRLASSGHKDD